jgi:hypothetical protein
MLYVAARGADLATVGRITGGNHFQVIARERGKSGQKERWPSLLRLNGPQSGDPNHERLLTGGGC